MKKTEERIKNILEYDRMYDVENWIEYIKECTFKTEFIPISSEETKHFLKFIQENLCNNIKRENYEKPFW